MGRSNTIYVDVDGTLHAGHTPIANVVIRVRELFEEGETLYLWSFGGAEYARRWATQLGIEHCFSAFLAKPDIYIDDEPMSHWARCSHWLPSDV